MKYTNLPKSWGVLCETEDIMNDMPELVKCLEYTFPKKNIRCRLSNMSTFQRYVGKDKSDNLENWSVFAQEKFINLYTYQEFLQLIEANSSDNIFYETY